MPGSTTKKEKTADMFKLMWSMKKKGDKPHYKPGTDKKYKKYQKESLSVKDTKKLNKASALDQSKDPKDWDSARARRTEIDYKDLMRQIKAKKKMRSEEASYKQRDKALKKSKKAMDYRHRTIHKGGDDDVNEATTMRDNNLFGNAYAGSYETLKKKIGSKKKHNKPAFKEGISFKDFRIESSAAWQRKEGKNKEGGLNEKGRKSYERENPGSDLKAPQPEGGSRKKSFCARMGGMKKKLTSKKTANDPDSRINKALRKWKCNEEDKAFNYVLDKLRKKHGKDAVITKTSKPKPPSEAQKKKAAAERKKRQDAENKAYAARAKKAGFKSTQDYTNVVARYGSEDNYNKGKGLGT